MTELCELLEWDSQFFGYRIGKAKVHRVNDHQMQGIIDWCQRNHIDCLYFLSDADDPTTSQLMTERHFDLVDIRVTLERPFRSDCSPFTPHIRVRSCKDEDIHYLKAIAKQSFQTSRFYFDRHFSDHLCNSLYETWIEKSCQGYADYVNVAEVEGKPVGFVTVTIEGQVGEIGLVGVDPSMRRRGIGYQSILATLQWLHNQNCTLVEVVTQGRNIAAQRLYQRCGFVTKSMQIWYHLWSKDGRI